MAILLKKFLWYPKGSTTSTELLDVVKINTRQVADASASTCDITLVNPLAKIKNSNLLHKYVTDAGLTKFGEGDTIKVYFAYTQSTRDLDVTANSYDLLMTVELEEYQCDGNDNSTKVTLKCVDKTFSMLNKLHTFSYDRNWREPVTDSLGTAPIIIRDVIRKVSAEVSADNFAFDRNGRFNSTIKEFSIDARYTTGEFPGDPSDPPAHIQTRRPVTSTQSDGTFANNDRRNFPQTTIAKVFKPAYEFIKELSSQNHTNTASELSGGAPPRDRNYIFYIDQENRFHWFYPNDSQSTTLSGALTAVATTINVASTTGFLSSGIIQIGGEVIYYNGLTATSFLSCKRGYNNTASVAHSSGDTVSSSLKITVGDTSTGHTVYAFKLQRKTFDIINMVIFNAGNDLNGSGILDYLYNDTTDSKELKMTYKPYTQITKDMILQEITDGRLTKDNAVTSTFTYDGNRYKETTGNYSGGAGITTSWGGLVTSDSTYNSSVRTEAVVRGKAAAKALTQKRGSPRWKGTIELRGERFKIGRASCRER